MIINFNEKKGLMQGKAAAEQGSETSTTGSLTNA
jgi:hypothetical protein